jgi:CRP-like cAMP-binding protein
MRGRIVEFAKDEIICREGDNSSDLYHLVKGKLLVFTTSGTEVKAISHISAGEFFGELSFFDGKPRASSVIVLEDAQVVVFSKSELGSQLPTWYLETQKNLAKKIRLLDEVIQENSIRKSTEELIKPLSIEEQRKIYKLLTQQ